MHIGLTLPSRGRSAKIRRLVESIRRQHTRHQVTLCLGLDRDDPELAGYESVRRDYQCDLFRFHFTTLGKWQGIGAAFNAVCADMPAGVETITMLGDDMVFTSPADAIFDCIEQQFATWPADKIGCLVFNDESWNFRKRWFKRAKTPIAVNGFLHRNWLKALGEFLPVEARGDFADNYLTEICLALGRYRIVRELKIAHLHQNFDQREADHTGARKVAWEKETGYGNGGDTWHNVIKPMLPGKIAQLQAFMHGRVRVAA